MHPNFHSWFKDIVKEHAERLKAELAKQKPKTVTVWVRRGATHPDPIFGRIGLNDN